VNAVMNAVVLQEAMISRLDERILSSPEGRCSREFINIISCALWTKTINLKHNWKVQ
jgi:hypothetical protein